MSNAMSGVGATIGYSATQGGTPTALLEIKKISEPSPEGKLMEVTHLLSTSGWREKIMGFKDPGQIKVEGNFTKAGKAAALAQFCVLNWWTITFPDASTWKGQGYFNKPEGEIDFDNPISSGGMIDCTGPWAFVAGP